MSEIAILLTSHNRKDKTLACFRSIYKQKNTHHNTYTIFLVIDGSTDGTKEAVEEEFPEIQLIIGDGNLFWAGGMRLCYSNAKKNAKSFDYFLLLNDDTILHENAFDLLFDDHKNLKVDKCILVGSTEGKNPKIQNLTYGGQVLLNKYNSSSKIVLPNNTSPQICHLGNANIMLIPSNVIDQIGFLSEKFKHGIGDFEYTLRARKEGINSYITSKYLGICDINDNQLQHWKSAGQSSLKERISYLYHVKGLSYKEYMYYIRKYFPLYLTQAWFLLWMKTFFPFIWDKFKEKNCPPFLLNFL
jgi:GT2 family glycosyltransferase